MTTRRAFFATLSTAVAGFTILPPATTYQRIWKATRTIDFEPWVNQMPNLVPAISIPFWHQTTCRYRHLDKGYLELLESMIENNPDYFKYKAQGPLPE
jgi:hypothetical protein